MEPRLLQLLRIVVDEHVATAEPVGSQTLVERYKLEVSPATVRNWFAELDAAGLIIQPHTSGGRVPTEAGYRTYIDHFLPQKPLAKRERELLAQAASLPTEDGKRLKALAKVLSEFAGTSAFAGTNEADTFYTGLSQLFGNPEFRDWQRVVSLTEVLDRMDDVLNRLRHAREPGVRILIGSACPFGSGCSAVLIAPPSGGLVGMLAPMRMDYGYAYQLLTAAHELLS